ncbi:hypothetical protein MMC25_002225 [Agyrium rufum]|nr:hypothetical protein [Agyrium rufum]
MSRARPRPGTFSCRTMAHQAPQPISSYPSKRSVSPSSRTKLDRRLPSRLVYGHIPLPSARPTPRFRILRSRQDSTLLAILLLDLFEKITTREIPNQSSWMGHVHGALSLVRLRGLKEFRDPASLRILVRLSTNLLISCIASGNTVPAELVAIREHAQRRMGLKDLKWRLSERTIDFVNLCGVLGHGKAGAEECVRLSVDLDEECAMLASDLQADWQYTRVVQGCGTGRAFGLHIDFYPSRHVAQT